MVKINSNFDKLAGAYLFSEIARKRKEYEQNNPGVKLTRWGIGDTSEPLTQTAIRGLCYGVHKLESPLLYTGYGDEQGDMRLREAIAEKYERMGVNIDMKEVFISDGAKPDAANIQSLFDEGNTIAVQDPSYPVYVDSNVIAGRTEGFDKKRGQYKGIIYMPCTKENRFFPDVPSPSLWKRLVLESGGKADLIYLCSPNNPTGAVASKSQLEKFVNYARKNKSVIIFDAAYATFIRDNKPKSIYEIEGAKECAIEISSFSKSNGFTGVRLGWTVVPMRLVSEDSKPGQLNAMWNARQTRYFNGASNIVQEGGLAVLTENGERESRALTDFYLENAQIQRKVFEEKGLAVFGGNPFLWVQLPEEMKSWEFFDLMLEQAHVIVTPGAGFGPSGEGYVRVSPFNHREDILKGKKSIEENLLFDLF